jgi:hypothetical protein
MIIPDYDRAFITRERWSGDDQKYRMPPGGLLVAIAIESATGVLPAALGYYRAEFELTDGNDVALWGNIMWEYPLSTCGIAFEEPLPNANTQWSYHLKRIEPVEKCPDLTVTLIHIWEK